MFNQTLFIQSLKSSLILIILLLTGLYIYEQNVYTEPVHPVVKRFDLDPYPKLPLEKTKEIPVVSFNEKVKTLTDVVWCENRKSSRSINLVLSVIYNRAQEKTLDYLYTEAIKPKQFSCLNDELIVKKQKNNKQDQDQYELAKQAVQKFLTGTFKPVTRAKWYYAHKTIKKPSWAKDMKLLLVFEGHSYFN